MKETPLTPEGTTINTLVFHNSSKSKKNFQHETTERKTAYLLT